jgi:hypothetical protein
MDIDGYQIELRGGPLAGGTARIRDTEVRLRVVRGDGQLRTADERQPAGALPAGTRVIGTYGFSQREEAMVWFPARGD